MAYCDFVQEWGRAKKNSQKNSPTQDKQLTTDANELRLIDPNVRFKSLDVNRGCTKVTLCYNISEICRKNNTDPISQGNEIDAELRAARECVDMAWIRKGHSFELEAQEETVTTEKGVTKTVYRSMFTLRL